MLILNYLIFFTGLINYFSRRNAIQTGINTGISIGLSPKEINVNDLDTSLNNLNKNNIIPLYSSNLFTKIISTDNLLQENLSDSESDLDSKLLININENYINIYGPITAEGCFHIQEQLDNIIKQNKYFKINMYIQSTGGSLLPTFALVDYIKRSSIPIDTYINGFVASAATLISVSGNKRYITKNSLFLIHSLRAGIGEVNFNQLEDHYLNSGNMMNIVKNIYKENSEIDDEKLEYLLQHDLWLNATECLKYKLVDFII